MSATQVWIKEQFEKEAKENPTTDVWSLKRDLEEVKQDIKKLQEDVSWIAQKYS
jgi:hypothetical protein|tara:strand:- start:1109 stop:1270 length:162 start_codon:yes stop_codon:yes gene_type:complete